MKPASPYLTADEAARYLRFDKADGAVDMKGFYKFRYRHALRACGRGRRLLFRITDLDEALNNERAAADRAAKQRARQQRASHLQVVHGTKVGVRGR